MTASRGTVVLSIDLEFAWGMTDSPGAAARILSDRRRRETAYLERFLARCDEFEIPVTFAAVGHLCLDAPDATSGASAALPTNLPDDHFTALPDDHFAALPPGYPDALAGGQSAFDGRPSDGDPIDWDPETYHAPDAIDRIRRSPTAHEIATHTFSHVVCDAVDPAVLERDLQAVAAVYEARGLSPPTSFVAPRNRLPDYEVLRDCGIDVVRASAPAPARTTPGRYAVRLGQWARRSSPVVGAPATRDGLVETYARPYPTLTSVLLPVGRAEPLAPFRAVPLSIRQARHESYLLSGLREVAEHGGCLHLWSHLYNLANEAQWQPVESFLRALAAARDRGAVRIETMADQSRRVRAGMD